MATLEVSATETIPVPPARAWELLCDTARYAEWVAGTDEVTRTDGPAAPGSTYDEINPVLGPWKSKTHWTVEEFDAPRRQVHRGEGIPIASEFRVIMEVAPAGEGCEVTLALRGRSSKGPLGALLTGVLRGQVERDNRKSVQNLARLARELSPSGAGVA